MSKKDIILSIIGHLVLTSVILLISPAIGMFTPKVPIMMVKIDDSLPGGPPAGKSEPEARPKEISSPKPPKSKSEETPEEKAIPKTPKKKEPTEEKKLKADTKKKKEPEKEIKRDETEEVEEQANSKSKEQEPKDDGKGGLDVASTVGGTGTGVGIGSSNLPYNLGLVLNVIERNWRNPVTSPTPLTCTVYFQIDRSGTLIGQPVVEKSSGFSTFDQAAVYAIMGVKQFPAFPSSFNYQYIGLHLDFEYVPGK